MGLLDGTVDPSALSSALGPDGLDELRKYIALMQPSQDTIAQAKKNRLIDFGLGLMSARKGSELQAIGQSGLNAMGNYNKDLAAQQALQGQNVSQAMQMMGIARQTQTLKQQQDALRAFNDALKGSGQTTQGPPAGFQIPGGAGALMNAGVSGDQPGATSLPTQVPAAPANQRDQLANAAMLLHLAGGPDMSGSLKFKYPDPIALRAGADVIDPSTGQIQPGAPPIPGQYWDRAARRYVEATGGAEGAAKAAAIPEVVKRFTQPQEGIMPGGGSGILGTQGAAMYGNGPLPYGAPSPYQQQPQQAPTQGPQSGGPVQTKLSPEQNKNSEELGADAGAYRQAAAQSSKGIAELGQIRKTLDYFTPGPTLPARAKLAGIAQDVPFGLGRTVADALVPNSQTALPAIAGMEKFGVGLTAEQSKVFGSREGQQVIGMIKSSMPNAGMVPGAPQLILDAQMGVHQYIIDKAQGAEQWKAARGHNNSLDGFSEAWDRTHPVSSYISNLPALEALSQGKQPGASPEPSYAIAPAARGNVTVQQVLKSGTAEQKAKLAAKGYLVQQ